MAFELRILTADDHDAYNAFFAHGAARYPAHFRIDPADFRDRPFPTEPSGVGYTLVAHDGARWLGVATLEREQGRVKRRHIAWVLRMLVIEPNAGVGRALLRELKRIARSMPGVEKLNLTVAVDNAAAVHLYASEGFVPFAQERDAFRAGDTRVDELTMSLSLVDFAPTVL
ncbi:MAG TPA: GNAT family N-acetyltransferase [Polyangiaceae bacterium]|nr:GNAT family N-acetyltransferase [Polyangiaceae bacterium]